MDQLAAHFLLLAAASPLSAAEARELAALFAQKYPQLTKETMSSLRLDVEIAGEKIRQGQRP